jgi:hypothetical protein
MRDRWSLDLDCHRRSSSVRDNACSPATSSTSLHIQRLLLPSIVNIIDRTAQSSTEGRAFATSGVGSNDDVFDAEEVATVRQPVVQTVAEDVHEAAHGDDHGDSGRGGVGNRALNGREDGTTCYALYTL